MQRMSDKRLEGTILVLVTGTGQEVARDYCCYYC